MYSNSFAFRLFPEPKIVVLFTHLFQTCSISLLQERNCLLVVRSMDSNFSGGWRCLECNWTCPAVPDPEVTPTCGQREVMYCGRCEAVKCLEYTLTFVPQSQHGRTMPMPTAPGFNPTPNQLSRLQGVGCAGPSNPISHFNDACVASTSVSTMGMGNPMFPDPKTFSDLTVDVLVKLQKATAEYASLVEKELKDRTMCVVCFSELKEVIFYPCRHKCACVRCAEQLTDCPICRSKISERILPFEA